MSHTPRGAIAAAALLVIVSGCSKSEPVPVATPTPPAVAPTLAPTAAPPPPTAVPEPTAATVSGAEAKELVSPVALYPDPVLILVLQASTMPLQVVEADRFLQRYEQDTSLEPDAGWDSSVIGLLNYPAVIGMMSESLDWTQALGDAVLGDLGSVQTGVQELRWSAYTVGALRSNEYQDVVVDGREVRILPAKADAIALPQYDAGAMLAAAESAPTAAAPAAAPAAAAPSAAPVAAPAAPVAAAPVAVAPAAVPAVVYAEPQSSFWSDAAIFAGGAAVGGLLGYAIWGDDDDDDWHGGYEQPDWSRDINIEDSNIVIGDRYDRDRVEQQLRDRADRPANRPAARPNRPVPASAAGRPAQRPVPVGARPGAGAPAARPVQLPKPVKPVAVPKPAKPAGARPASAARPAAAPAAKVAKRPGDARPAPKAGLGDVRPAPQVKKESQRGQTSRAAQQKVAARPAAPARQPAPKIARPAAPPQRGGGLSPPRGGGHVSRDANRGKQSRGGGGGGRGKR